MSHKLFRTLGVAALIVGVSKMFHFHAWKRAGGSEGKKRAKHWHRPDGHEHPWFSHRKRWSDEEAEETEPDVEAGAAEAVA